jgi:hypothetical protein
LVSSYADNLGAIQTWLGDRTKDLADTSMPLLRPTPRGSPFGEPVPGVDGTSAERERTKAKPDGVIA